MKGPLACLLGSLLLATAASLASADELRLKDGTKIVGNIVGFEGDSFKVETTYGFALVRKDKVASIVISTPKPDAKKEPAKPATPPAEASSPANSSEKAAAKPAETPATSTAKAAAPKPSAPPTAPAKAPLEPPMRESLEGNLYTNFTYGFRLYKPPSWQLIEGARKTLPTAIVVMGTDDETTLFIVGREPLRQTLDLHAAASERRLRELYENYRPLGERRSSVAGLPAIEKRFRGSVEDHDWSVTVLTFARGQDVFTLIGMTYADSDLIQIQENVIARTISSLEFSK